MLLDCIDMHPTHATPSTLTISISDSDNLTIFKATSSSTIYGPNQTITTATDGTGDVDVSTKGLILYPVWVASAGSMQSDASSVCSSLTAASYNSTTGALTASLSSVSALTDQRDGNTYAIAKLADNNCWMIENLRINAEDTIGDAKKALAQGYGDDTANNRGKFIGLADSEDVNFTGSISSATDSTPANSLYYAGTQSGTATMNIGQINYAGFRMPRYNKNNTNLAANATNSAGTTQSKKWRSFRIISSTPASSLRPQPRIGVASESIGRLLRTISANRTICACMVPIYAQVRITTISFSASVLGV